MRIGFVAEPYEESNASGMGYVVLELMRNLATHAGRGDELVFYSSKPIDRLLVPGNFKNILVPRSFVKKFLWFLFNGKGVDVLIFIAPLLPLIANKKVKMLLACQELASQKIRPATVSGRLFAFLRDRILMPISISRAGGVIAASQATKEDLIKFYKVPSGKITVIYDGFQDLRRFENEVGARELAHEKPYFFFAGKVKYRKNVHGIVAAFVKFKEKTGARCGLVIAGDYGGAYHKAIAEELKKHGLSGQVLFAGYATGKRLYAFYKNALACVFPSINEGFGMPIVEAMSLGIPVITSKISSMAEVAGDAALLVDPHDTADIANAMERIFSDEKLRRELSRKGAERARAFSWPKAAEEYLRTVKTIGGARR